MNPTLERNLDTVPDTTGANIPGSAQTRSKVSMLMPEVYLVKDEKTTWEDVGGSFGLSKEVINYLGVNFFSMKLKDQTIAYDKTTNTITIVHTGNKASVLSLPKSSVVAYEHMKLAA